MKPTLKIKKSITIQLPTEISQLLPLSGFILGKLYSPPEASSSPLLSKNWRS